MVVDPTTGEVKKKLEVGGNPSSLAKAADGSKVFVSVSDADAVITVDTTSHEVVDTQAVGEPSLGAADGTPLPASSPTSLALNGDDLYVIRAADNAVSVLDAATLEPKGAIPVGWYPTAVAVSGDTLVVTNGKGVGTGPLAKGQSGKKSMKGSLSLVSLSDVNLPESTATVEANVRRPSEVYPFECDGTFPIPTTTGGKTPIKHIVLLVRENKTYDTLFGDWPFGDGDPSNIRAYIRLGVLGEAFQADKRVVVVIDEVDKADLEFPNDLLWELDRMSFHIPETGDTITARQRPVVIVTSNAEKELPDAFLRRCVFHYIAFPDPEQMAEIVRVHHPNLQDDLLRAAIEAFYVVRQMDGLAKRPSTSELVDWVQALVVGGIPAERVVEELPFLGVVLKKPQDLEVARRHLAVRAQRGAGVQRRLRDG